MKSFVKIFAIVFVIGSCYGKVDHHHHQHHHQPSHYHGHRGYTTVLTSGPVVAKSAPAVLRKGVAAIPAAAPVQYYSTAPVYHSHAASGGYYGSTPAHVHAHAAPAGYYSSGPAHVHSHVAPAGYYSSGPAYAYAGAPLQEHVALLSTAGKPKVYSQSIPAAAVRNVETVMVTKTITPVVTKTTTHHTRAEPALSLGHVQGSLPTFMMGYSQGAVGHPKVAPVKFNTAYTSYSNPTVGINGPVVYSGPAVGFASGVVAAAPVSAGVVVPQPVVKSIAPAYSYVPGTALSLSSYGADAYSLPVANFLELRSGKPVYAAAQPIAYEYKK